MNEKSNKKNNGIDVGAKHLSPSSVRTVEKQQYQKKETME
jgi:hypothetical protein